MVSSILNAHLVWEEHILQVETGKFLASIALSVVHMGLLSKQDVHNLKIGHAKNVIAALLVTMQQGSAPIYGTHSVWHALKEHIHLEGQ